MSAGPIGQEISSKNSLPKHMSNQDSRTRCQIIHLDTKNRDSTYKQGLENEFKKL